MESETELLWNKSWNGRLLRYSVHNKTFSVARLEAFASRLLLYFQKNRLDSWISGTASGKYAAAGAAADANGDISNPLRCGCHSNSPAAACQERGHGRSDPVCVGL
jgi:hypothetical protein